MKEVAIVAGEVYSTDSRVHHFSVHWIEMFYLQYKDLISAAIFRRQRQMNSEANNMLGIAYIYIFANVRDTVFYEDRNKPTYYIIFNLG